MYDTPGHIKNMYCKNCVVGLPGTLKKRGSVAHCGKRQSDFGCSFERRGGALGQNRQSFTCKFGIDTVELKRSKAHEDRENAEINQNYRCPDAPK